MVGLSRPLRAPLSDKSLRGDIVPTDPVRDSAQAKARPKQVAFANPVADKPLKRSRLTDKLLLAHLNCDRLPRTAAREKRRADLTDANASRRQRAKRPAKSRRFVSKKT